MPASRKRDYYEILGVARDVDATELKAAYRTLALRYHPDKNPDDRAAEERFKELSEAYAVLADPDRRARYDRLGHAGLATVAGAGFDVQDLFDGIVGAFRGGVRKARSERGRPRDVRYALELTFAEAVLGCQKTIRFDAGGECPACRGSGGRPGAAARRCSACNGTGEVRVQEGFLRATRTCGACKGRGRLYAAPCGACGGSGRTSRPREFVVRIPPGSEDGNVRIVRGAGESGVNGKTGDLHIILKVAPHPLLTREGHDLACEVPISFAEAALGTSIEVPTLEGKVRMKVPAGTQSGKVFRLRGKGLPRGAGRGDQHVRVVVETPANLSARQRRLLEDLAGAEPDAGLPRRRSFIAKMRALYGT